MKTTYNKIYVYMLIVFISLSSLFSLNLRLSDSQRRSKFEEERKEKIYINKLTSDYNSSPENFLKS